MKNLRELSKSKMVLQPIQSPPRRSINETQLKNVIHNHQNKMEQFTNTFLSITQMQCQLMKQSNTMMEKLNGTMEKLIDKMDSKTNIKFKGKKEKVKNNQQQNQKNNQEQSKQKKKSNKNKQKPIEKQQEKINKQNEQNNPQQQQNQQQTKRQLLQQLINSTPQRQKNKLEPRNNFLRFDPPLFSTINDQQQKLRQIKGYISQCLRQIASVSFNLYFNQKLQFDKVKVYFCQNFLSVLCNMICLNEYQQKHYYLYSQLSDHLNNESLPFLKLSYPHSQQKQISRELKGRILEKDIFNQNRFDIIGRSNIKVTWYDIPFNMQTQKQTVRQIMKVINYIISLPNQKVKKKQSQFTLYELFQKDFNDIFQNIQNKNWTNYFFNFNKDKKISFLKTYPGKQNDQNQQNKWQHINKYLKQKCQLKQEFQKQYQTYKQKVKSYTKYKIGRKISSNVPLYDQNQIEEGQLIYKDSSIFRIITKWIDSLIQQFSNPLQSVYLRNIPLRLMDGSQFSNQSTNSKKKLYQIYCSKHSLIYTQNNEIKQSMIQQFYKNTLFCLMFIDKDIQTCSFNESLVGNVCTFVQKMSQNYISNAILNLIQHLKYIQQTYRTYFNQTQENIKQLDKDKVQLDQLIKKPLLINLKLGDLMRCQMTSKQTQIVAIYQYLCLLCDFMPQIFQLVRVKDRFKGPNKDILINIWYRQSIMIEIQLAIKTQTSFIQCSDKFSHFIYELRRSFLGPIPQLCSIWSKFSPKFQYFNKKSQQRIFQPFQNNSQEQCKHQKFGPFKQRLKFPFYCVNCNKLFTNLKDRQICNNCKSYRCIKCKNIFQIKLQSLPLAHEIQQRTAGIDENQIQVALNLQNMQMKRVILFKIFNQKHIYSFNLMYEQLPNFQVSNVKLQLQKTQQDQLWDNWFEKKQFFKNFTLFQCKKDFLNKISRNKIIQQILIQDWFPKQIKNIFKKQLKSFSFAIQIQPKLPQQSKANIVKSLFISKYVQMLKHIQKLFIFPVNLQIVPMNLNKLTLLKQLFLSSTNIKEINLQNLINIQILDLSCNLFQNLNSIANLQNLKQLKNLNLYKNQLNQFIYKQNLQLNNLLILNLSKNKLTLLKKFPIFINLQQLYLSNNSLKSAQDFLSLKKLKILQLNSNNIKSLKGFPLLNNLKSLQISNNKMNNLKGLQKLPNLIQFSAMQCDLQTLQGFPSQFESLQILWLSQNKIKNFTGLPNLPNLKNLTLSKNNIVSLQNLPDFPKLEILRLDFNQLKSIKGLPSYQYLKQLTLQRNKIDNLLKFPKLPKLQDFTLCQNLIINFAGLPQFPKLQRFSAHNCKIQSFIGIPSLPNLKYFNILNNKYQNLVGFPKYQNLQQLLIGSNLTSLKGIPKFPKLKQFTLTSSPKLANLNGLQNLIHLQKLSLPQKYHQYVKKKYPIFDSIYIDSSQFQQNLYAL